MSMVVMILYDIKIELIFFKTKKSYLKHILLPKWSLFNNVDFHVITFIYTQYHYFALFLIGLVIRYYSRILFDLKYEKKYYYLRNVTLYSGFNRIDNLHNCSECLLLAIRN